MKVYHQTWHNYKWNIDSLNEGIWDWLIFSPINMDAEKLTNHIDPKIKSTSFLDPQFYTLNVARWQLETYPFFPGNLKCDMNTDDLGSHSDDLAKLCIDYQVSNWFEYLVIPTKYNKENPNEYLQEYDDFFVKPFCKYTKDQWITTKILLSLIVKESMITDTTKRDEILNWLTWRPQISGLYLIFENDFNSKQIKDFSYLLNVLNFIKILKANSLQVHIWYCNTEAILYSIAMPDSVSMGSYENLRSFGIKRFEKVEITNTRSPNARLFSGKLLQWIDYWYVQTIKALVKNYETYFEESKFNPLNFAPEIDWQFKQVEPYRHFFTIFYTYCKQLPLEQKDRINIVKEDIKTAIWLFKEIEESDVLLDGNSDWSHLPIWHNVVAAFQKELI